MIEHSDTPDFLNFGIATSFSETPTLSYGQLSGSEFVKQLVAPLKTESIMLLIESGWSADRVMQMTVQRMNKLVNAKRASGPTPDSPPDFLKFNQAVSAIRELQKSGSIDFFFDSIEVPMGDPVPKELLSGADFLAAADKGWNFRDVGNGKYQLSGKSQDLYLQVESQEFNESTLCLAQLLGEDPTKKIRIDMEPRSVLGTMFYLSHVIDILPEHLANGLATTTCYPDGEVFDWSLVAGNLLKVHYSKKKPKDAYVAVRYRGYWFFICDNDRSSKSTFILLSGMIELRAGGGTGNAPILTLSAGR